MFELKQELFWLSQECSVVIPLQMFDNKQTHLQAVMVLMSVLTTTLLPGNCWSHRIMPRAGQCNILNNLVNNTVLHS